MFCTCGYTSRSWKLWNLELVCVCVPTNLSRLSAITDRLATHLPHNYKIPEDSSWLDLCTNLMSLCTEGLIDHFIVFRVFHDHYIYDYIFYGLTTFLCWCVCAFVCLLTCCCITEANPMHGNTDAHKRRSLGLSHDNNLRNARPLTWDAVSRKSASPPYRL